MPTSDQQPKQSCSVPEVLHSGWAPQQSSVPQVIDHDTSMQPTPEPHALASQLSPGVNIRIGSAQPAEHGLSSQKIVSTAPGTW